MENNNLHIIGNPGKRKLIYDPDLARRVNEETAAEIKRKQLEEKLKKKKSPKQPQQEPQKPSQTAIPQTPNFTEAFFLQGDFGKSINEKIQLKYKDYEVISKIQYNDQEKIVKGSNPFYVVAVNEILQEQFPEQKIRTATQADLEKILKSNALPLLGYYKDKGYYEDSSLVLRTKNNPNKYLAEDLFNQFKNKGITLREDSSYVIPLFTLKLRKDEQSEYKLAFDITDLTLQAHFEAPILNSENGYINPSEMDESTGLPTKVYTDQVSGNRQLWTRNSGLSGLFLGKGLVLGSYWVDLAYSGEFGRVVLVRAAGTSQNFQSLN